MPQDWRPWLEAGGVCLLTLSGGGLGWWFSKRPAPWWLAGYFLPLIAILIYATGMHVPALAGCPPFSWLVAGRTKFTIAGFLAALILITPLSRIRRRSARILIFSLLVLLAWHMSVWPFLAPAFNRHYLASLQTTIDPNGVCLQSNDYNCGPAAAVTALRRLGFTAEEGEIAILAHTSSAIGTPPDLLTTALRKRYGPEGLEADHRVFHNVKELHDAGLTLVIIKFSFMLDHYIAVLEVTQDAVIVGDPLQGLNRWSYEEFERRWRHHGIVLQRHETRSPSAN